MVFTDAELRELATKVLGLLVAESQGIDEVPVATTMEGVHSLPAYQEIEGILKTVTVPITLLGKPAIDAAEAARLVIEEVEKALVATNEATKSAINATTGLDAIKQAVVNATSDLEALKKETLVVKDETTKEETVKTTRLAEEVIQAAGESILSVEMAIEESVVATEESIAATKLTIEAGILAEDAAERAKQHAENPPKMGENGNWWHWDEVAQSYIDSGVLAKGGVLYPTFEINPDDMCVYMNYQNEIEARMFEMDENGCLIFNTN